MRNRYKRDAWLLDDDILLHGYVDKRGFHPEKGLPCGFGLQIVNKKSKNKIWFHSLNTAMKKTGVRNVAGGSAFFAIDVGLYKTKAICSTALVESLEFTELSDRFEDPGALTNKELAGIIARGLSQAGYGNTSFLNVKVRVYVQNKDTLSARCFTDNIFYNGNEYRMNVWYSEKKPSFFSSFYQEAIVDKSE